MWVLVVDCDKNGIFAKIFIDGDNDEYTTFYLMGDADGGFGSMVPTCRDYPRYPASEAY